MRKTAMMAVAAMAAANLWAIQGSLTTDTETLTGDIKWQARGKKYIVSVKKGKTMLDMERDLADVRSLDIPKPASTRPWSRLKAATARRRSRCSRRS